MSVSNEIINVLNDLGSRFGIALDWSNQNVVPYIQDLIIRIARLEIANSIIGIVSGILCLIITIWAINKTIKSYRDDCYGAWEGYLWLAMILGIIGIVALALGIDGLTQAIFLPELTAIEYVKDIVSTIK